MATLYGPKIVTDGLILCLDAGNSKSYPGSGTTWTDLVGAKNGTLNNGVSYSNKNKGYLIFDGSNDYVNTSLVTSATNSITISVWFRTLNINQAGQMIFYNGSDMGGNGYGISVNNEGTTDGKILFLYGAVAWIDTGFQTANDTWYNAVMVIESNRSNKLYINGSLVFTGSSYNINTPTSKTEIGRNDFPSLRYFNGNIAQACMYNRVLSSSEIVQNYDALKGRFLGADDFEPSQIAGLAAWYDFNDTSTVTVSTGISSVADKSGNGRTLQQATANNQPAWTANSVNGKYAAVFDGVNDTLAASFTLSQPVTIFLVAKFNNGSFGTDTLFDGGSGNVMRAFRSDTNQMALYAGVNAVGGNTNPEAFAVMEFVFNGAQSEWMQNGTSQFVLDAGTLTPGGIRLAMFGNGFSAPGAVSIAAVVMYAAELSSSERRAVRLWLGNAYDIMVT